ncbi:MAG: hypothetical protein HRT74_14385 [Flavobacteriales bacterium]|nr:hypothetical protein [Flavobacteriales bacterium]
MKQKAPTAYSAWRTACEVCPPAASENLYIYGARLLKKEIKQAKSDDNAERKEVLIDSLMGVYDLRIEHYASTSRNANNACKVKGFKGGDLFNYRKDEFAAANQLFLESFECLGNATAASTISGYYLTRYKMFQKAEGEEKEEIRAELIANYLVLQEIADYNIANSEKEKKKEGYVKAKGNLDEIFILIAECENMIPIFQRKVEADPENLDQNKKFLKLMNLRECDESDFYLELAQTVHAVEPTHESGYAIGIGLLKKQDYKEAMKYLDEAVELCAECAEEERYLLRAGQVANILKQTGKARGYAKKILAKNPNSGEAYILIGDAVVAAAASCDDGALGQRAMYWLAVDYYYKAKSNDSSLAEKAQKKINTYSKQFPEKSDLFKNGVDEGSIFTCCSGETTKARARK